MIYAPLVMPEVITGLSLLLMFVAIGLDRGFVTVTMAQITFSMCYVAVVVQSRLVSFDRSIEEAAMNLGSPPARTFFQITKSEERRVGSDCASPCRSRWSTSLFTKIPQLHYGR